MSLISEISRNPQSALENFPDSKGVAYGKDQGISSDFSESEKKIDQVLADFFGLSKIPSKKYHYLSQLQERKVECRYSPFIQGGLSEILSKKWEGSCEILSYTWLVRKARSPALSEPIFYQINTPYLPHPMIVGSQSGDRLWGCLNGNDIGIMEKLLLSAGKSEMIYFQPDEKTHLKSIDSCLQQLQAYVSHASLITSFLIHSKAEQIGHACAFIKKEDACAWFDPNYGEISFAHFEDFAHWFRSEALDGALSYFFFREKAELDQICVASLFPIPEITEEELREKQENPALLEPIYQKYQEAKKARSQQKVSLIGHPTINTYLLDSPLILPEEYKELRFI